MTTAYVDPQSGHNPTTGVAIPASWGDTVRDDLEFLVTGVGCAINASGTSVGSGGSGSLIAFDSETWDTDGYHSNVTNNTRITIPSGLGGKYQFIVCLESAAPGGGSAANTRAILYRVNGGTAVRLTQMMPPNLTSVPATLNASYVLSLSAGDYVEFIFYQDSTVTLSVTGTVFCGWWGR